MSSLSRLLTLEERKVLRAVERECVRKLPVIRKRKTGENYTEYEKRRDIKLYELALTAAENQINDDNMNALAAGTPRGVDE